MRNKPWVSQENSLSPEAGSRVYEPEHGRLDLRDRLIAFFREQDVLIADEDAGENASLICSGRLDSLALFNLTIWVEQESGRPFDVTTLDLAREWDTLSGIVAFVEELRGERAHPNGQTGRAAEVDLEWDTKS
jgi:acyl carrier protein